MLSKSYEQVQQLMEIITQTSNAPQRETANALTAARKTFELLLVLNRLDNRLLARSGGQNTADKAKSGAKNSMQAIENELRLLQSLCGHESKYCLISINWESDFRFASGVRAPPWRQAYGELCYLVAGTHDVGKVVLTCSQEGVFVNKGYYVDAHGVERLNYEKDGDVSPNVTACLRGISPHFSAHIDGQETAFVEEEDGFSDSDGSDEDVAAQDARAPSSKSLLGVAAGDDDEASGPRSRPATRGTSREDRRVEEDHGHHQHRDKERGDKDKDKDRHAAGSGALAATHPPGGSRGDHMAKTSGGGGGGAAAGGTSGKGKSPRKGALTTSAIKGPRVLSDKWALLQLDDQSRVGRHAGFGGATAGGLASSTPRLPPLGGTSRRSPPRGGQTARGEATGARSPQRSSRPNKGRVMRDESSSDEDYAETLVLERGAAHDKNEVSTDYTQINKLVKFLKSGTQRATIIALVALRDFSLTETKNQLAVRDVGGIEPLIGLLSSSQSDNSATNLRLRLGSVVLLRDIALNPQIQVTIAQMGGIPPLVEMLKDNSDQAKCHAAETLANLARNARNRGLIRKCGGIRALVGLLKGARMRTDVKDAKEVPRAAALALWACTKNNHNKTAVRNAGGIPPLIRLLDSASPDVIVPVAGVIEELAVDPRNRLEIRETDKTANPPGAVRLLVMHLSSPSVEVSTQAAAALYQLGEDDGVRRLVHEYRGLEVLARLLATTDQDALEKVSGAIWKLAASSDNALVFNQLDVIPRLVQLFETSTEAIQINVAGALWNCAKIASNRVSIRNAGGLKGLVSLLTSTNHHLLINVTGALWACGMDPTNMRIICENDGLRLLWSLLKSPNPKVQANAAGAIGPCMDDAKNVADVGRSFVGALSILISLLSSEDEDVQANVCAAIAKIAQDDENLAVITEDGVLPLLARLTVAKGDTVRKQLAYAICRCAPRGRNREQFGKLNAVVPLVDFLRSEDAEVHRATAMALEKLSENSANSLAMWNAGAVPLLINLIGSTDEILQESAASTIANIRHHHASN